jgi:hypothetical protein
MRRVKHPARPLVKVLRQVLSLVLRQVKHQALHRFRPLFPLRPRPLVYRAWEIGMVAPITVNAVRITALLDGGVVDVDR